jgi:hypothetical protein
MPNHRSIVWSVCPTTRCLPGSIARCPTSVRRSTGPDSHGLAIGSCRRPKSYRQWWMNSWRRYPPWTTSTTVATRCRLSTFGSAAQSSPVSSRHCLRFLSTTTSSRRIGRGLLHSQWKGTSTWRSFERPELPFGAGNAPFVRALCAPVDGGQDSECRLTARRRITNKMLLLNTVMFGIGLFAAISDGGIVLWFGVALFGCGLVLFVVDRIRRTTLAIDRYSVTVIGPFGGRKSYEIANCGPFGVLHQTVGRRGRIDWLTFDYQGKHPRTWLQRASAKTGRGEHSTSGGRLRIQSGCNRRTTEQLPRRSAPALGQRIDAEQQAHAISASENGICRLASRSLMAGPVKLAVTSGFDTPRSGGRLELLL